MAIRAFISILMLSVLPIWVPSAGVIIQEFKWQHGKKAFQLNIAIEPEAYEYFASLPRVLKNHGYYSAPSSKHSFVPQLVEGLEKLADQAKLNQNQKVLMVIAFVQSLQYQSDKNFDYPKFPIETLVERGGDCEDTSALLAAILEEMLVDCILIAPENHMGVGIRCFNCVGNHQTLDKKKYYYVETTSKGWRPGMIPEDYRGRKVELMPVSRAKTIEEILADEPLFISPELAKEGSIGEYTDRSIDLKNGTAIFTVTDTRLREDGVIEVSRKRYSRTNRKK